MKLHVLLASLLFLLPLAAAAQGDCYQLLYDKGLAAYKAGRYSEALKKWEAAKTCPDVPAQQDLDSRIRQARAKIPTPVKKPSSKPTASDTNAGDALWDIVKDSQDPKTVQKYLDQYPAGRHAAAARQRIRELQPAAPATQADKTAPPPGPAQQQAPAGFAFVPGGTFQMGDTFNEGGGDEKPVHEVTVSSFYLGKTEVTFEEFDAFCTATGREKPGDEGWGRGQRPVINVDWYDAVEYCNWRSKQDKLQPVYSIDKTTQDPNNKNTSDTKKWTVRIDRNAKGYRLPTEAEWEYAARATPSPPGEGRGGVGGGKVRFGNGKDLADPSQMNFDASAAYKQDYSIVGEYRGQTVPVGSLQTPNALGLHDMAGNVWEWCQDWYDAGYYAQSAGATNPSGPGSGSFRVLRGGSCFRIPQYCRSAFRYFDYPVNRIRNRGLRLALSLQ